MTLIGLFRLVRELQPFDMLATIQVPKNIRRITNQLPAPCYPDSRPYSPTSWPVADPRRVGCGEVFHAGVLSWVTASCGLYFCGQIKATARASRSDGAVERGEVRTAAESSLSVPLPLPARRPFQDGGVLFSLFSVSLCAPPGHSVTFGEPPLVRCVAGVVQRSPPLLPAGSGAAAVDSSAAGSNRGAG